MKQSRLALPLLLLAATSASAGVVTDHDRTADLGKYHSYQWDQKAQMPSPVAQDRTIRAIDTQLASRGLRRLDGGADLVLSFTGSATDETPLDTTGSSTTGWRQSDVHATTAPAGTLVVDLTDASTQQLVWRGKASGTVVHDADKMQKRVFRATEKLFHRYPPKH